MSKQTHEMTPEEYRNVCMRHIWVYVAMIAIEIPVLFFNVQMLLDTMLTGVTILVASYAVAVMFCAFGATLVLLITEFIGYTQAESRVAEARQLHEEVMLQNSESSEP